MHIFVCLGKSYTAVYLNDDIICITPKEVGTRKQCHCDVWHINCTLVQAEYRSISPVVFSSIYV